QQSAVSDQPSTLTDSLQTIVEQAQRIHQTLRDLMQFARPARPQKQAVDMPGLLQEVFTALADTAAERTVVLRRPEPGPPLFIQADPNHLRIALTCLLQNGIEAAGPAGWAAARIETAARDQAAVIFEDSGRGPDPAQHEHLFDPFYSGRQAGRGRGLGL